MAKKGKIKISLPKFGGHNTKGKTDQSKKSEKSSEIPDNPTLRSIYSSEDGQPLNMTTLERKPKRTALKIGIVSFLILLLVTGVSLASFFTFNQDRQKSRGEKSAALTINTEPEVASGQSMSMTITYVNNDDASLVDSRLHIQYPIGFTFESADPAPAEGENVWTIGSVSSGSAGQIKIRGQLIGQVPSTKSVTATLNYKLSNFNYQFEKKISQDVKINRAIVSIDVEGPLKATDLQTSTYTITYRNEADFSLNNLVVLANYPAGFTFKSSEPRAKSEDKVWSIESLAPKSEGKMKIQGILSGSVDESKEMKVRLGLIDQNGDFNFQTEDTALTLIVKPEISLSLRINDTSDTLAVTPGDNLQYHLLYENVSDLELQDIVLELNSQTNPDNPPVEEVIKWDPFDQQYAGIREKNTLRWTKEQKTELAQVKPHQKGEIVFSLPVRETIDLKLENRRNVQINNKLTIPEFKLDGFELDSIKVPTSEMAVKINSPVKITAEGRYFTEEFEPLGSGPIPPEVGKTTSYRIYWYVTNPLNEVSDVEVQTILPKGVFWLGQSQTSAGDGLTFDAATRAVTWRMNKIPPHTGTLLSQLEAYFMISITPGSEEVGKLVALTEETTVKAKDGFTSNELTDNDNLITTDLENDVAAKGRGVVVQTTPDSTNEPKVLPEEVQ